MTFPRKQSEAGCSADQESHAAEKPYDYREDPFYQYLAHVVARGRRSRTKEGRNKRLRARRASDLDFRDRERARRYGMTLRQLREMEARQNNACAICGRSGCELVLDHDHVTDEVRELLCIPCNLLLGFARDDPSILRAATEYLERLRSRSAAVSNDMGRAEETVRVNDRLSFRPRDPGRAQRERGEGEPQSSKHRIALICRCAKSPSLVYWIHPFAGMTPSLAANYPGSSPATKA